MRSDAIGRRNLATPVSSRRGGDLGDGQALGAEALDHLRQASVSLRVILPPPGTTMALAPVAAFLKTPKSVVWAEVGDVVQFHRPSAGRAVGRRSVVIASSYAMCGTLAGISTVEDCFQIWRSSLR